MPGMVIGCAEAALGEDEDEVCLSFLNANLQKK